MGGRGRVTRRHWGLGRGRRTAVRTAGDKDALCFRVCAGIYRAAFPGPASCVCSRQGTRARASSPGRAAQRQHLVECYQGRTWNDALCFRSRSAAGSRGRGRCPAWRQHPGRARRASAMSSTLLALTSGGGEQSGSALASAARTRPAGNPTEGVSGPPLTIWCLFAPGWCARTLPPSHGSDGCQSLCRW